MDSELAGTLAEMAADDERIRRLAMGEGDAFVVRLDSATASELQRVDARNAERLRAILSRHGWPGRSLVGEQGSNDAWLIAQHTDHQPDLQRRALELLTEAVDKGEASARDLAYLTDRVRVNEGREQVFGTQIRNVEDGVATPWPVEDPEHIDHRRAQVGLDPLDRYAREFANALQGDQKPLGPCPRKRQPRTISNAGCSSRIGTVRLALTLVVRSLAAGRAAAVGPA